jgi:hypothetical protein
VQRHGLLVPSGGAGGPGRLDRLHKVLLARLRDADRIDWPRVMVDSSSIRAVGAGQNRDRIPASQATAHPFRPRCLYSRSLPPADLHRTSALIYCAPAFNADNSANALQHCIASLNSPKIRPLSKQMCFLRAIALQPLLRDSVRKQDGLKKSTSQVLRILTWRAGRRRLVETILLRSVA